MKQFYLNGFWFPSDAVMTAFRAASDEIKNYGADMNTLIELLGKPGSFKR